MYTIERSWAYETAAKQLLQSCQTHPQIIKTHGWQDLLEVVPVNTVTLYIICSEGFLWPAVVIHRLLPSILPLAIAVLNTYRAVSYMEAGILRLLRVNLGKHGFYIIPTSTVNPENAWLSSFGMAPCKRRMRQIVHSSFDSLTLSGRVIIWSCISRQWMLSSNKSTLDLAPLGFEEGHLLSQ